MRRLALWAGAVLLPACCVWSKTSAVMPATQVAMVQQLEQETPALVRWYDKERKDDDKPIHYDTPDEIPDDAKTVLGAYCSAVWVSNDVMLTAAHCVDDIGKPKADPVDPEDPASKLLKLLQMLHNGQDPTKEDQRWNPVGQTLYYSLRGDITTKGEKYHTAVVKAVNWDNDIALVTAGDPGTHPVAPLRSGDIHDGEEIHVVGHPAGMWWTYVHGYVSAQRPEYDDHNGHVYPVIQVTAPIWFGNSGGGAFDADGNLVGMADAISRQVPNTGYLIPADSIRAFMVHERVLPPAR